MQSRLIQIFAAFLLLMSAQQAAAQAPDQSATLKIATREAAPFAMKQTDGQWSGLAIDLWRGIASDLGLKFELQETPLADMVTGVADGRFAASVGALTVTPSREEKIDFTHPFYTTGFGIVTGRSPPPWLALLRNFFTIEFLQAILLLAGVLLTVGVAFWWFERRANPEQFGGKATKGIGSGFWFSAVTMTTVGYGDKAPRTLGGKLVAIVWMFAAIIIISTFTGMIASSLTESRLGGEIRGVSDLQSASVGSIGGSATEEWLNRNGVGFKRYPTVTTGLDAVSKGEISAFVYDLPLLRYLVREKYADKLRLAPNAYGRQDYAFGLPQGSALRERINEALLRRIDGDQWTTQVKQTLGGDD